MGTKEVKLVNSDQVALVDDFDYGMVMEYKWYLDQRQNGLCYAKTYIWEKGGHRGAKGRAHTKYLHRFVMYEPQYEIDHRDNNGLNCVHLNLRICSRTENNGNLRKHFNNQTGYKGIVFTKRCKDGPRWEARIKHQGKTYCLGTFKTPIDAARAYDEKAKELFGTFAKTNF